MGNIGKRLAAFVGMAAMMGQSEPYSNAYETPLRMRYGGAYGGGYHDPLNQTKRQRKANKSRRRTSSKMRAYNRRNS